MADWYMDGLKFQCTQCGNCCTGGPGVVWVDKEEIRRISEFISMHTDDMWGPILRRVGTKVSLTERPNHDCIFLQQTDEGGRVCGIYPVRPQQCRTWPFWTQNLKSQRAWEQARKAMPCPGMDEGKRYDYVQIESIRKAKPWYTKEGERREASG